MKKTGSKKVKRVGEYVLGKTLGKGTYGKVKRAIHSQTLSQVSVTSLVYAYVPIFTTTKVAVKIIAMKNQTTPSDIEKEISMLKLLKHPNIVKLIDVIREDGKIYMILELITGGWSFSLTVTFFLSYMVLHIYFPSVVEIKISEKDQEDL